MGVKAQDFRFLNLILVEETGLAQIDGITIGDKSHSQIQTVPFA